MSAPTLGSKWQATLLSLELGWDGYRAVRIAEAAIAAVEQFHVVPCADGGIQLEIRKDGFDVEIAIDPDGSIESVTVVR